MDNFSLSLPSLSIHPLFTDLPMNLPLISETYIFDRLIQNTRRYVPLNVNPAVATSILSLSGIRTREKDKSAARGSEREKLIPRR